jgi:putative hydrolase of the HAD superfamily
MKNKPVAEFILKKETILFYLFHTLMGLESNWSNHPATSDLLGIDKKVWNEQLIEKSRERLSGENKDPFSIIKKMAHAVNPNLSDDLILKATENRILRCEGALRNIPSGTIGILKILKGMNKNIGLISNADVKEVFGWKKSPIREYFDSVVFSCDVGFVKPEKEIYEYSFC